MTARALQSTAQVGGTSRIEQLEAENEALRDTLAFYELTIFGDILQFPAEWNLTKLENRLLGVLLSLNIAHRDAIMTALYRGQVDDEPASKIIDVLVCKLRHKLKPWNIVIRNLTGVGFTIDQPRRGELRAALKLLGPPGAERDRALAGPLERVHRVPERISPLPESTL